MKYKINGPHKVINGVSNKQKNPQHIPIIKKNNPKSFIFSNLFTNISDEIIIIKNDIEYMKLNHI